MWSYKIPKDRITVRDFPLLVRFGRSQLHPIGLPMRLNRRYTKSLCRLPDVVITGIKEIELGGLLS